MDAAAGGGGGGENKAKDERLRTVVEPATIKAFVAGLVIGNVNKGLLLGLTVGVLGGVYVQQNYPGMPDVTNAWKDLIKRWNRSSGDSNSKR